MCDVDSYIEFGTTGLVFKHFVLCVDSDVLARGSRKSSCSYFESGRVAEQKPNENPSTSIMDDGDLNGKKSKLEDNGSPSNTSAPKKQKLDTDETENLDHSAKWTANKSEVKESPGITSMPNWQKTCQGSRRNRKCGTTTEAAYT